MSGELIELAAGVHAWLDDEPGPGHPNAGAVVEADGVTVVDALMVPSQYEPFAEAVEAFGLPVRRLVLTSSHIEYVGGSARFARAAIYGTAQVSAHLDQPPDVEVLRRLFPDQAGELDDELRTRPVTHVVSEPVALTPAVQLVPAAGDLEQNLLVALPAAGVTFGGGVCSFGVTPLAFQADLQAWADTLAEVAGLGGIVVPGHGPIGGEEELLAQATYLLACVDGSVPGGPWDDWPARDHDEVNLERAALLAAGDRSVPPSMLRRAGLA